MALIYATVEELRDYSLGVLPDDDDYLERILAVAERDVDRFAGYWPVLTSGRKFDPLAMEAGPRAALSRATCAQAEYRLAMGEDFFTEAQPESLSGQDANYSGRLPRLGPKANEELYDGQLVKTVGRGAGRSYSGAGYGDVPGGVQLPLSQDSSNQWSGEVEDAGFRT